MAAAHIDHGYAWVVLVACFFIELLNNGVISSLGIFLLPWQEHFVTSVTQVSWILSLNIGLALIVAPIGSALCKLFSIRQVIMTGAVMSSAGFVLASIATSLWHLYVAFTIAGLGFALSILPNFVILAYYFDKRLGRANGVAQAGVALGAFAIPPLLRVFIDGYGWQGAMLILGGIIANIGVCASFFRPTQLEYQNRLSTKKRIESRDLPGTAKGSQNESSDTKKPDESKESQNESSDTKKCVLITKESQSSHTDCTTEEKSEIHNIGINQIDPEIDNQPTTCSDQNAQDKTASSNHQGNQELSVDIKPNEEQNRNIFLKAVTSGISELFEVKLLTNIHYCFLVTTAFFFGFSYIIVIYYLPARAESVGISPFNAALLVSVFGIGSVLSRLTHGYIIDYKILSVSTLTSLSYVFSAAASALYPVSDHYVSLVILSLCNGVASGVYNATTPVLTKDYVGIEHLSGGLGWVLLATGIASILGAFSSGVLVDRTGSYSIPFYIAGAGFLVCSLLLLIRPISQKFDAKSKKGTLPKNLKVDELEMGGADAEHSV